MIRSNFIILDVQRCVYELLDYLSKNTAPFTSWQVILGFPEAETFTEFTKPLIYVLKPNIIDQIKHQGGLVNYSLELSVGAWDDRKTGGDEEISVIESQLNYFFNNPKECNYTTTFSVKLGTTQYTGTNLQSMGIGIEGVMSSRTIETSDVKEFRKELTLKINA